MGRVVYIKPMVARNMLLVRVLGLVVPSVGKVVYMKGCVHEADSGNQQAAGHGVRARSASCW